MLRLQVGKSTSKHSVTAHHPKLAQPGTKFWLQAGSRSRQPLRWAGKVANPSGLYPGEPTNTLNFWVPQQGNSATLGSPQQLPGSDPRKLREAAAAKDADAYKISRRAAGAGWGQPGFPAEQPEGTEGTRTGRGAPAGPER